MSSAQRVTWRDPFEPTAPDSHEFGALVEALRAVQESVTRSRPLRDVVERAAAGLRAVAEMLRPYEVDEDEQIAGRVWTEAGRAQALAPPIHIVEVGPRTATATVSFGRFHSGRGAVHGGAIPLVFDEVMARLANSDGRPMARTAYLRTDYRKVVPLETEVEIQAWFVSEEGRKRLMRAALRLHGEVLAECEGLWVALRPGQP